eukprot:Gregarina_sp_Pseudo_9__558@NODE_1359_length_1664_cov_3_768000_g1270_i0_p2_GENE_NODE_1359_length_1664_cov_3_768000_g1270_i0NODE_1359_length_1664_cov_3_768000_g1270_i0_p2_ORF_typecomplete_len206_score74_88ING/PF12998_7/0_001HCV_core/PF01542_18/0_072_NODE_1359_length_1664_cov_3_768000_g1270_i0102719
MMPHHVRVLEDGLNALSGSVLRQFALMLELDRKAADVGVQLDLLRAPYLSHVRETASPAPHKTSPASRRVSAGGRRQTRRSQTPTGGRVSRAETPAPDAPLQRIAELQALQSRLWTEKVLLGQQCLAHVQHALAGVSDVSHNITQQLLSDYNSAVGSHSRPSMRTAALIASQAMHQSLTSLEGSSAWRGGDTGSSVVSRSRKRQT